MSYVLDGIPTAMTGHGSDSEVIFDVECRCGFRIWVCEGVSELGRARQESSLRFHYNNCRLARANGCAAREVAKP